MLGRGLIAIASIILIFFIFAFLNFDKNYTKTYTSALCDGNVCRDYLFTCVDGEVIDNVSISGFVTFSELWIDTRENKDYC